MLPVLEFVFSSFWVFAGCMILLWFATAAFIGAAACLCVGAAALFGGHGPGTDAPPAERRPF